MEIGDLVTYLGETYVLRGLDPMSVPDRQAVLEHVGSGERRDAPFGEVEPAPEDG
ncbi:MAG TPA: hypothetical protein VNI55_04275 [Gaiellaceae bacterium]|nr:hypothetical protein [Gaiellaceae bacterium]